MVIIDIIDNSLEGFKGNYNFLNSVVDELNEHGVPFVLASDLCAGEKFSNAIVIKKESNTLNLDRSIGDSSFLNEYFIYNKLDSDGVVSCSFSKKYISEDAIINASKDIVGNILKSSYRQDGVKTYNLEPSDFRYIVKPGDSLFDVAFRFNTTAKEIAEKNNLTTSEIYPGQVLILSALKTNSETSRYIVRSGDSLEDIAETYNTTVEDLREYNNLTDDNLKIGQVIVINPIGQGNRPLRYIVASGDSLYSIARKFDVSVSDIKKINQLDSNYLKVGQQLLLPE